MKLYSQKTKEIEELDFTKTKLVKIYTCGPTVYDYPHIGNWYTFIRYDVLNRALITSGHKTNWVMNITDVGHLVSDADEGMDKLQKGAEREGKTAWQVAEFYGSYFKNGLKRLNFSKVNHLPKATDYINEQIDLVKNLEDKGFTYKINDGIYFDTSKFKDYAKFANLNLSGQNEGARVSINDEKRNPSDFAVWKFSPIGEKRDMEWESPWGKGFPGWHLECSAMIHAILKEPIDIHGGGIDHIPVHHSNEIAQSEAAYDQELARYWFHCNHIMVNGKKMSKSLGNLYTLEDIEKKHLPMIVFRLTVLAGHYRSQSEFDWEVMESQKQRLQNWIDKLSEIKQTEYTADSCIKSFQSDILGALNNDLNTPLALSVIDNYAHKVGIAEIDHFTDLINQTLGLDLTDYLKPINEDTIKLLNERQLARSTKDWAKSDQIRDQLHDQGIKLQDTLNQQIWSRII